MIHVFKGSALHSKFTTRTSFERMQIERRTFGSTSYVLWVIVPLREPEYSCYEGKEVDNTTAHHDLALMEENVLPRSSKDLTINPVFTRHWVRKNRRKTGMGIFRKQAINGARAGSVRCTARGAGAHAFWPWAAAHASPAGGPSMHPPQYPPSCRTIAHTVRR